MIGVEIGELIIMKVSKWEKIKNKYPKSSLEMDYAIVKDFEDGTILIEKSRLDFVINYGQEE